MPLQASLSCKKQPTRKRAEVKITVEVGDEEGVEDIELDLTAETDPAVATTHRIRIGQAEAWFKLVIDDEIRETPVGKALQELWFAIKLEEEKV